MSDGSDESLLDSIFSPNDALPVFNASKMGEKLKLSKKTITEFQKLFLKKEGVKVSLKESERKVLELIDYVKSIYKPIEL